MAARYGDRLWVAALDLADGAAIEAVVGRAFAALGRIDTVIGNAGYALFGAAEEATAAQVRRQLDINLLGAIELIRACLPHLRAQGGGRVLQLSSEGGQIAYPGFALYHASKWGIEGFVEAVAQEVAPFGIAFTLVEPGPAATGFAQGLDRTEPLPAYAGTPADAIRQALEDGSFGISGDPQKMVDAMISSLDQVPAPRRLTLGSTAYTHVHAALTQRLAELEAQRELACSADL
ncbi:SDR family oxidoreductase [Xanthomonas sp. Kuri4-1]